MANKIEQIRGLATDFRQAIERSDRRVLGITFKSFPRGSCGDASILLGAYLTDKGIEPLTYVCGQRENWSHAWLESNDIIIDISGDQFDDNDSPVVVSRDSSWHGRFERTDESLADFRNYQGMGVAHLPIACAEILRNI